MLYLTSAGPDRHRGRHHGRELGGDIRRSLLHANWDGERSPREIEAGEAMWAWLNDNQRWLAEEIEGIAAGAEISLEAARHLNLFSATRQFGDECTTLGFCESNRGPVLAKTFDIGEERDVYLMQRVRPESGYRFMRVSWAGNVWAPTGINEAGLAVGASSAPPAPEQNAYAMPWHMTLNPVLRECATTADAVALLRSMPIAGKGHNYAILDEHGHGVVVEKSGERQATVASERDVICATNHFTTEEFEEIETPETDRTQSSLARLTWMRETFIQHRDRPRLTLEALAEALRKDDGEGRLCRKGYMGAHTHYALIYVCRERTIWLSDGYPCEERFVEQEL
jgi:predicted choloylglycine hydrolase